MTQILNIKSGRSYILNRNEVELNLNLNLYTFYSELENNIQQYVGDDPIEPYLALVRFLEQQCLQTITWRKSLSSARMECYKTFYDNPKYENDKRYVDTIIKCVSTLN